MANALTRRPAGTAVAATQAYDPFARAGEMDASGSGQYLKFNGKTGEFTYGQAADELPEGSLLAVDMNQAKWGWICWVDSQVKEERMTRVIDGDPDDEAALPDHGPYTKYDDGSEDGWQKQRLLIFRNVVTGEEYIYKTSSGSGIRAFGALMKDYGRQYKQYPGLIPVVQTGVSSFIPKNNKKVGKVYAPEFKIVEWRDENDLLAGLGQDGGEDPGNYAEDGEQGADESYVEGESEGTYAEDDGGEVAGDYQDDGVIDGTAEDITDQQPEPEPAPVQPRQPVRQPAAPVAQTRQPVTQAAQTRQPVTQAAPTRPAPAAAQTRQPVTQAAQTRQPVTQAAQTRPAPAAAQTRPAPTLQPRPAAAPQAQPDPSAPATRNRRF